MNSWNVASVRCDTSLGVSDQTSSLGFSGALPGFFMKDTIPALLFSPSQVYLGAPALLRIRSYQKMPKRQNSSCVENLLICCNTPDSSQLLILSVIFSDKISPKQNLVGPINKKYTGQTRDSTLALIKTLLHQEKKIGVTTL